MRYRPAGLISGIIVSQICLAVFVAIILLERRRRKMSGQQGPEDQAQQHPFRPHLENETQSSANPAEGGA